MNKNIEMINIYDFDKTIYDGDCTVDFYLFCIRHYPSVMLKWPELICSSILLGLKIINLTKFKEIFFKFLTKIDDLDTAIDDFWTGHNKKIKSWYLEQKKDTDLINSASPEFILKNICDNLGVRLIGSNVDPNTGIYTGLNNKGSEKVRRLYEEYPHITINEFYSDSLSDSPLAEISKKAFLVKGNLIKNWPNS